MQYTQQIREAKSMVEQAQIQLDSFEYNIDGPDVERQLYENLNRGKELLCYGARLNN